MPLAKCRSMCDPAEKGGKASSLTGASSMSFISRASCLISATRTRSVSVDTDIQTTSNMCWVPHGRTMVVGRQVNLRLAPRRFQDCEADLYGTARKGAAVFRRRPVSHCLKEFVEDFRPPRHPRT